MKKSIFLLGLSAVLLGSFIPGLSDNVMADEISESSILQEADRQGFDEIAETVEIFSNQVEVETGESISIEKRNSIANLIELQLQEAEAKLENLHLTEAMKKDKGMSIQGISLTDSTIISYYQQNLDMAATIRNIYSAVKEENGIPAAEVYRLSIFYAFVKTGGPWDLKSFLGTYNTYRFKDNFKTGEYIGNHHYGYIGKAVGFNDSVLKSAAGMYQIYSETSDWKFISSYFDDPRDQEAITDGLIDYKNGFRFNYVIA